MSGRSQTKPVGPGERERPWAQWTWTRQRGQFSLHLQLMAADVTGKGTDKRIGWVGSA